MHKTDPHNPRSWSTYKKLRVAFGPVLTGFIGSLTVPIYLGSIPGIIEHFHISSTLAISPISFAALGFFLGPIFAVSISEVLGRCWVFRISIPIATVCTIVAGTARNFQTLVIARCLASVAISPSISVAAGVINDLWDVRDDRLGTVVLVLFASSLVWATEIGPPISTAIVRDTGDWRWTFYLSAILLGICLLTLLNPETFAPAIVRQQTRREGKEVESPGSVATVFGIATGRALHMILVEPIVRYTTIMSGIYQAALYCFYVAFPVAFKSTYRFTDYESGLAFLPLFIGSVLGLAVIMVLDRLKYRPAVAWAEQRRETVPPEKRLYPAMLGCVMMPISLFWLAWTARPSIHWVVPLLACLPLGISIECILLTLPIYRNDVYGAQLGSSALAADNIMRYGASIPFPLFTIQMVDKIGFDWSCSLIGFISLVLVPVPWVFYKYGPALRARSHYIPTTVEIDATVLSSEATVLSIHVPQTHIVSDTF